VHNHFETFRAQAASLRDGEGLPRFVEQEFRNFLQCGWLAGGFARFRCVDCGSNPVKAPWRIDGAKVRRAFDQLLSNGG